MPDISYRRHRFPPVIIQHAVWLYLRFTLSYRDVEELLAERRLDISYETVRCWVLKFGPVIARRLRRCRPRPSTRWHLDEMVVRIAGRQMYLWRAVDHEGEPHVGSANTGRNRCVAGAELKFRIHSPPAVSRANHRFLSVEPTSRAALDLARNAQRLPIRQNAPGRVLLAAANAASSSQAVSLPCRAGRRFGLNSIGSR